MNVIWLNIHWIIERNWVLMRIVYGLLAYGCYSIGAFAPGLALGLITFQTTFHEFIHAIAVLLVKGKIKEIALISKGEGIDFTTATPFSGRIVFFSGFIFETTCVFTASYSLLVAGSIFTWYGIGIVAMALYYHMKKGSDFNLCIKTKGI